MSGWAQEGSLLQRLHSWIFFWTILRVNYTGYRFRALFLAHIAFIIYKLGPLVVGLTKYCT